MPDEMIEQVDIPAPPPPMATSELMDKRINALYIEVRRLLDLRSDMPEKARLATLFEGI